MNADAIKQRLANLGWDSKPTDLMRFYFAVRHAVELCDANLVKHPNTKHFQGYEQRVQLDGHQFGEQ